MKKRRIIYVDASTVDGESKISLYDTENNLTNILQLIDISNNNIAETYAVLYAILYVVKNDYSHCHILSDNLPATQNKKILELAKQKGVSLSWIPREINVVADKITKLEPTVKQKEWHILNLFYEILFKGDKN